MKAAVLRHLGRLEIEDLSLDGPRADEVRIRVLASGLCHTDYHFITGDMPMALPALLGHEACGIVEAVGENVRDLEPGDYVVTCMTGFCGTCDECQSGHNYRCGDRPGQPIDRPAGSRLLAAGDEPVFQYANLGGFAEEMVVHHRMVMKLPEGIPPACAALLGCGVLTGVGAVLNSARVAAGSTVAVIGCGGVGLNVIQGARIAGAERIVAVDLQPAKLELARKFGATDVVLGGASSVAQVQEMTRGGVDCAFEVIGQVGTMRDACAMLGMGGTAVLLGAAPAGAEVSLPVVWFGTNEIRVIGSRMGGAPFQLMLPKLIRFYLRGDLMLDELVSQTVPLEQINESYARMIAGEVARSVVVF